ncbi:hypothetical protein LTR56_012274 [Elasticomyces elasticus]|nr:hypothetical protein LTR22_021039 [Elasticomyces elasticus]KAK3639697.1 hypothetical protein LTR56_012274 [Elasticomyces elasticus]KAK4922559.1 hypothetical protein LTR49_010086 [Elasticomyces elasticus]KAK5760732.1 hypothetical protein LTS12_009090 [Elasticomyces elasticus]
MASDLQDVRMSDGCNIKAKILGHGPDKPLLLTVHGAPGLSTHRETEAWCGPFADIFRVLVFDLRGCGESDKQRPYTHARWIQDVDELRQWAKADKFVMIGGSNGGFLTLDYALAYQQHLYGIIVSDTAAQQGHWGLMNMLKTALTNNRIKPDPDQVLRMFSGRCIDQMDLLTGFGSIAALYESPPEVKEHAEVDVGSVLSGATVPFYEAANAAMGDCLSRYDVRDRLKEIKVPAFVGVGRYDWVTPVSCGEELEAGLPTSKLVIYERSGHFPGLEEKTKFQKDVREFVKTMDVPGLKWVKA